MTGRFLTPDVEEMAAIGMAMLTANETALLLSKTLPEGPSATAIQNAVRRLGSEIEDQREAIKQTMESKAPLPHVGGGQDPPDSGGQGRHRLGPGQTSRRDAR